MTAAVADILRRSLALLGPNGEHWSRETGARDADGQFVDVLDPRAIRWCPCSAIGVVGVSSGNTAADRQDAYHALSRVVRREMITFATEPNTTFADIRAAFERAIEAERSTP